MKIGIVTLPLHVNYGGILQAYALQTVLERMGHDVWVINRPMSLHFRLPLWKMPLAYGKRILKKILIDRRTVIFREQQLRRETPLIRQHTEAFIGRYIHSYYIDSLSDIRREDFDAFVVGSDQIWRPAYLRGLRWGDYDRFAFLGFAQGWSVRRLVYAASFGVDEWEFPEAITPRLAELAQAFEAVSVREDTGVELCRRYLGVEAVHLLDPTLLLSTDDYLALPRAAQTPPSPGDLLCYILDPSPAKDALIERVAGHHRLTPFHVSAGGQYAPLSERIVPPLEQWLQGFADARFVVTDSFHGAVFSILFGRPFVVIANRGRGLSRMESLLRMFHLEDHLLMDPAQCTPESLPMSLPADLPDRLSALRRQAYEFLARLS